MIEHAPKFQVGNPAELLLKMNICTVYPHTCVYPCSFEFLYDLMSIFAELLLKMNIDEGDALPIGQDYSNMGNEASPRPGRSRKDSTLMSWEQFFAQFRDHVSKPAADLLACVERIGNSRSADCSR